LPNHVQAVGSVRLPSEICKSQAAGLPENMGGKTINICSSEQMMSKTVVDVEDEAVPPAEDCWKHMPQCSGGPITTDMSSFTESCSPKVQLLIRNFVDRPSSIPIPSRRSASSSSSGPSAPPPGIVTAPTGPPKPPPKYVKAPPGPPPAPLPICPPGEPKSCQPKQKAQSCQPTPGKMPKFTHGGSAPSGFSDSAIPKSIRYLTANLHGESAVQSNGPPSSPCAQFSPMGHRQGSTAGPPDAAKVDGPPPAQQDWPARHSRPFSISKTVSSSHARHSGAGRCLQLSSWI
jgi:hypothetical protein